MFLKLKIKESVYYVKYMGEKMKNLVALAVLLLSINSFARSIITKQSAELVNLNLDTDFAKSKGLEESNFASVLVDYTKDEITLVVEKPWSCPKDKFCATVMPAPLVLTLPLISIEVDGCGFITLIAEVDKMPVDGVKETIEITDYSKGVCEIVVVNPLVVTFTESWIDRIKGSLVERVSYFYGFQGLK